MTEVDPALLPGVTGTNPKLQSPRPRVLFCHAQGKARFELIPKLKAASFRRLHGSDALVSELDDRHGELPERLFTCRVPGHRGSQNAHVRVRLAT